MLPDEDRLHGGIGIGQRLGDAQADMPGDPCVGETDIEQMRCEAELGGDARPIEEVIPAAVRWGIALREEVFRRPVSVQAEAAPFAGAQQHGAALFAVRPPAMLALAVVGCGGPGQTIPLAVNMDAIPAPAKVNAPVRVAVVSFEDVRTDRSKIGRYQHYVESTVDTLVPAGGSAADQITTFVVEYLKRAGFPVTRVQPGQAVAPGSADVVLSGQIESYWSEAVSRFARTELVAKNRLVLKAANVGDGRYVFPPVTKCEQFR